MDISSGRVRTEKQVQREREYGDRFLSHILVTSNNRDESSSYYEDNCSGGPFLTNCI